MKKPFQLKPQDALLLLKLVTRPQKDKRITDLANELGISASEVSQGLDRLHRALLLSADKRTPIRANAADFIIYGVPYAFPAVVGSVGRGVVTAHSAPPLSKKIVADAGDNFVWQFSEGTSRGQAVSPLYPSVPKAALSDPKLHELLALVDALRLGRAREKAIAAEELKQRIMSDTSQPQDGSKIS